MTRKEEIIQAAQRIQNWDFQFFYYQGAIWADKTMLDKVCDYLSKLERCKLTSRAGLFHMRVFSEEDIEKLRKAMEE